MPRRAVRRRTGARTPPGKLPQPARALRRRRGPALGRERIVLARAMEGRRRALPVRRAAQGPAGQELGGAGRDLRRASGPPKPPTPKNFTVSHNTRPRAWTKCASDSNRWADASAPLSPRPLLEPHNHDRSIPSHIADTRSHTDLRHHPDRSRGRRRFRGSRARGGRRRPRCRRPPRRRARRSPSWACTPTCCAPSTRWDSPNRCPCRRRPSRRSPPART